MTDRDPLYRRHRFPAEVIAHAVWLTNSSSNSKVTGNPPVVSTTSGYDVSAPGVSGENSLPSPVGDYQTPAHLANLADRDRGYVEAASSANTRKANASDWKHFSAWCRRSNLALLSPRPHTVGLYTARASGTAERGTKANSVSTIEWRLSSLSLNYTQRGLSLDRKDRHIATVLAGIRNSHARPPVQKEAVMVEDINASTDLRTHYGAITPLGQQKCISPKSATFWRISSGVDSR